MASWLAPLQSSVCSSCWIGQLSYNWGELHLNYLICNCFFSIKSLPYSSLIHSPSGQRGKFEGQPPVKLIFNIHGTSVNDCSFNESSFAREWVRRSSGFLIIHFINRTSQMRNGVLFAHLIMPRTLKLVSFPPSPWSHTQLLDKPSLQAWIAMNISEWCNHPLSLCCCWKNGPDPLGMAHSTVWVQKEQQWRFSFASHNWAALHPTGVLGSGPLLPSVHTGLWGCRMGAGSVSTTWQAQIILPPWLFVTIAFCMEHVMFSLIDTPGGRSSQ